MNPAQLLVASALLLVAPLTLAEGDAAQGKALFATQCGFCHSTEQGKNLMGPSLLGVFDRSSGQAPAFNYSAALQAAKLKWDDANLDKWLTKPADLVPGNMMMYPGQADAQSRQNLVAYLKTLK
ncbi:TPA: c-type cytochrome [Pseudomonas putida]|uniref:C-type cytochrome n=1 Tax=Pseudomonas putida TaxID=303 RepID=A0ABD7B7D1_PSEPU|nr:MULTISPECIES: c-type cytochrome [Pseudomonas]PYG98579.1 cytochrome c2 [Arthrobacter stackebrandtii]MBA1318904.1 c-type cytochrome [Pseudomonas monteilii]MCE1020763.1 c-type cytochrome [Pseudomonas monteilii]MCE1038247.1 c-type cytochrome [Pseudomonas monteilii]MCE1089857.1 c-type cytochrome [Pseudomonas monteilii]